jgi:hypothetical protein
MREKTNMTATKLFLVGFLIFIQTEKLCLILATPAKTHFIQCLDSSIIVIVGGVLAIDRD